MGVSLAEGFLMNGLLKSAARQPDIIAELRSLMIMGIAFIEGTFFVTLVFSFIINKEKYKLGKREDSRWKKVSIQPSILVLLPLI